MHTIDTCHPLTPHTHSHYIHMYTLHVHAMHLYTLHMCTAHNHIYHLPTAHESYIYAHTHTTNACTHIKYTTVTSQPMHTTHVTYAHTLHIPPRTTYTHTTTTWFLGFCGTQSFCLLSHCSLLAQASSLAMDSSPPDYCTSPILPSVCFTFNGPGSWTQTEPSGGRFHALSPLTGTQWLADFHASLGSLSGPICHLPA